MDGFWQALMPGLYSQRMDTAEDNNHHSAPPLEDLPQDQVRDRPSTDTVSVKMDKPFPLWRVPRELRDMIYQEVACLPDENVDNGKPPTSYLALQNLMSVNQQVRHECRDYFKEQTVTIDITSTEVKFLGRKIPMAQLPLLTIPVCMKGVENWAIHVTGNQHRIWPMKGEAELFLRTSLGLILHYLKMNEFVTKNLTFRIQCPCDPSVPKDSCMDENHYLLSALRFQAHVPGSLVLEIVCQTYTLDHEFEGIRSDVKRRKGKYPNFIDPDLSEWARLWKQAGSMLQDSAKVRYAVCDAWVLLHLDVGQRFTQSLEDGRRTLTEKKAEAHEKAENLAKAIAWAEAKEKEKRDSFMKRKAEAEAMAEEQKARAEAEARAKENEEYEEAVAFIDMLAVATTKPGQGTEAITKWKRAKAKAALQARCQARLQMEQDCKARYKHKGGDKAKDQINDISEADAEASAAGEGSNTDIAEHASFETNLDKMAAIVEEGAKIIDESRKYRSTLEAQKKRVEAVAVNTPPSADTASGKQPSTASPTKTEPKGKAVINPGIDSVKSNRIAKEVLRRNEARKRKNKWWKAGLIDQEWFENNGLRFRYPDF